MKTLISIVAAVGLLVLGAQAQNGPAGFTVPSITNAAATSLETSLTSPTAISITPGRDIIVTPAVTGTNNLATFQTNVVTYTWNLTIDGTNWTTTGPITHTMLLYGSTQKVDVVVLNTNYTRLASKIRLDKVNLTGTNVLTSNIIYRQVPR